ncbi:hypothetical protein L596_030194 [Steinernema carpocapsae]|uniref:Uncharacterized protein n=1 Tax=Steinernema carpocapsae TaxID=34508 RepID=A0A4U5LS13_STECR|nr:hypothetical protein L596_030194 [Steinernema carpocapsae]
MLRRPSPTPPPGCSDATLCSGCSYAPTTPASAVCSQSGDSAALLRYSKRQILDLNPEETGEPIIFSDEMLVALDAISRQNYGYILNSLCEPDSSFMESSYADFGDAFDSVPSSSSLWEIFHTPLGVKPVAIPVAGDDGKIPLLPIYVFESILKSPLEGDGFDVFRGPLPAPTKVPAAYEELLGLEPLSGDIEMKPTSKCFTPKRTARLPRGDKYPTDKKKEAPPTAAVFRPRSKSNRRKKKRGHRGGGRGAQKSEAEEPSAVACE